MGERNERLIIIIKKTLMRRTEGDAASHHICRDLVSREILDIFVLSVDYFRQLASVHHLLKHPHFHSAVEFGVVGCVGSHYLSDS